MCTNNRGISRLDARYKIFSNWLYKWRVPYAEGILDGITVRRGWSTADDLFIYVFIDAVMFGTSVSGRGGYAATGTHMAAGVAKSRKHQVYEDYASKRCYYS